MAHSNQQYYHQQHTAGYPPAANPPLGYPPAANPPLGYPPVDNNHVYPPSWNNINNSMPAAAATSFGSNQPLGYLPLDNNHVYPPSWNNINNSMPAAAATSFGSNYGMGHPSNGFPTYATPMIAVIGPQFCSPSPVDLVITRKMLKLTEGNFTVEDMNGNVMFQIKDGFQLLRYRRVLCDAQGNPIVTLQEKIMSVHNRWNAFRGASQNQRDLLFSAKESSLLQLKINLDVFLASNGNEGICDFKVKGSWLERSCVIYGGNSKVIIAQMHKKLTAGSVLLGKDKFMVTVYPNIDCAFIVALIVLSDAINCEI